MVDGLVIEVARGIDGGGAQRKDERRTVACDKCFEAALECLLRVAVARGVLVVKQKAGRLRVWRPVGLRRSEPGRKERQVARGREDAVEQGIAAGRRQTERLPQVVHGLRPVPGGPHPQAQRRFCRAGARGRCSRCSQGACGRNGRVDGGDKRDRRQGAADPGDAGGIDDQRPGQRQHLGDEQVGPATNGQQIRIGGGRCGMINWRSTYSLPVLGSLTRASPRRSHPTRDRSGRTGANATPAAAILSA